MLFELRRIKESDVFGLVAAFSMEKFPETAEEFVKHVNENVDDSYFWKQLTQPKPTDDLYVIEYEHNPATDEFDYRCCRGIVHMLENGKIGAYRPQSAVEQGTCDAFVIRRNMKDLRIVKEKQNEN